MRGLVSGLFALQSDQLKGEEKKEPLSSVAFLGSTVARRDLKSTRRESGR